MAIHSRRRPLALCLASAAYGTEAAADVTPVCPEPLDVEGIDYPIRLVPTGWDGKGGAGGHTVTVDGRNTVRLGYDSRVYWADVCHAGYYNNTGYTGINFLGKRLEFTVDLAGAGCGCNVAFYLVSMKHNYQQSECFDYYCDANAVCGVRCDEVDLMEANMYAWHSTLHTSHDGDGFAGGYGGGDGWNGPRDWTNNSYGPKDASCVDTTKPFQVAVSFHTDNLDELHDMEVELSQAGKSCTVSMRLSQYPGIPDLTMALTDMTPVMSFWGSDKMYWLDGEGADGKGPCNEDYNEDDLKKCPKHVTISDMSIRKLQNPTKYINILDDRETDSEDTKTTKVLPATCPGSTHVNGYGNVHLVPTGWKTPGAAQVSVKWDGAIRPYMDGRGYFANTCTAGQYDVTQYLALNLLGKTFTYTVDLSGAVCGCNAALYLTAMRWNEHASTCSDYYCDANSVCGESCAEIGLQEANQYAWHSTLHTKYDHVGLKCGYGGGFGWNGPRDWGSDDYGPGAKCIDTTKPFNAAHSFPLDSTGTLAALVVELSQVTSGVECKLKTQIANYVGNGELTEVLKRGVTPVVSYWSWERMFWMDGPGLDGKGPCIEDTPDKCGDFVTFTNISISDYSEESQATQGNAFKMGDHECYEGWRPATTCTHEFSYRGEMMTGCTTTGYRGKGWCSVDTVYDGSWAKCLPCTVTTITTTTHPPTTPDPQVMPSMPPIVTISSKRQVGLNAQCGGTGFADDVECQEGLECVSHNEWWSQCKPPEMHCYNGWKPTRECVAVFIFDDKHEVGCSMKNVGDGNAWCSLDARYVGRKAQCERCGSPSDRTSPPNFDPWAVTYNQSRKRKRKLFPNDLNGIRPTSEIFLQKDAMVVVDNHTDWLHSSTVLVGTGVPLLVSVALASVAFACGRHRYRRSTSDPSDGQSETLIRQPMELRVVESGLYEPPGAVAGPDFPDAMLLRA